MNNKKVALPKHKKSSCSGSHIFSSLRGFFFFNVRLCVQMSIHINLGTPCENSNNYREGYFLVGLTQIIMVGKYFQ